MAPPKTKYKKRQRGVQLEDALWKFCGEESLRTGDCFHPDKGSSSEFVRRALKSYLLSKYPNIKLNKNLSSVDWNEAY